MSARDGSANAPTGRPNRGRQTALRSVGVLAFVGGLTASWVLLTPGREPVPRSRASSSAGGSVSQEPQRRAPAEPSSPEKADPPPPPAGPSEGTALGRAPQATTTHLGITVLDRLVRRPIPGARVRAIAPSPTDRALGWSVADAVLAEGTTDEAGRIDVSVAAPLAGVRIRAEAPGHVPGALVLDREPSAAVVLELERGLGLSGRVVDRRGRPVPGLSVVARHADLPSEGDLARALVAWGPHCVVRTTAGEDSRFSMNGLAQGQRWIVAAHGRGWVPIGYGRSSAAGQSDLELVLQPIRVVRVELRHAQTGRPLDWAAAITLRAPGTVRAWGNEPREIDCGSPETTLPIGQEPDRPSRYVLAAYFRDGESAAAEASLEVRASACEPARVTVPLCTPEDLASVAETVPIALRPLHADGSGTVRVSSPGKIGGWLGFSTLLEVEGVGVIGGRLRDGTWEFRGVPAGRRRLRLIEFMSSSAWVESYLGAGESTPVEVAFPHPTGVRVEVYAPDGRRIPAPEAVGYTTMLNARTGARIPAPFLIPALDTNGAAAALATPIWPMAPGAYAIEAHHFGYEPALLAPVELTEGEVRTLALHLGRPR